MAVVKQLRITGRVQGVGFRHYMTRTAQGLGITGWVHNRHDGSVEAVVAGDAENIDRIIAWAQRGPAKAAVTNVAVLEADGSYTDFVTLPTA